MKSISTLPLCRDYLVQFEITNVFRIRLNQFFQFKVVRLVDFSIWIYAVYCSWCQAQIFVLNHLRSDVFSLTTCVLSDDRIFVARAESHYRGIANIEIMHIAHQFKSLCRIHFKVESKCSRQSIKDVPNSFLNRFVFQSHRHTLAIQSMLFCPTKHFYTLCIKLCLHNFSLKQI